MRSEQRLLPLEKSWHADPLSLRLKARQLAEELRQGTVHAYFDALPNEAIDALSDSDLASFPIGLSLLFERVAKGSWHSTRLPMSVVSILLNDPKAKPDLQCKTCKIVVPTRRYKFSVKQRNDYFKACPACGSVLVQFADAVA